MANLSENAFVAAAVASWLGIEKKLPASASHGVLTYDPDCLRDGRRGEVVAKVFRKGKKIAVLYSSGAGQRYGSWGRVGACVGQMVRDAWRALNTDKGNVLIAGGRHADLSCEPADVVKRLSSEGKYAEALALAPFVGVTKRDVPLPKLPDAGGAPSYRAEAIRNQVADAPHYLVPELAKARRVKERAEKIEAEKERARQRRLRDRLLPFEQAFCGAQHRLDDLRRGRWSVETLLANCGLTQWVGDIMFKVTSPNRLPCSGGAAGDQWPEPGTWTRVVTPRVCSSGWHLCTAAGLVQWIKPGQVQELWIAEGDAAMPMSSQRDKTAYSRARLVRLLASGDLKALGVPKQDENAIAAAAAAVEKARGEYDMARQGY